MIVVGLLSPVMAYLIKPTIDEVFINKDINALQWISLSILAVFFFKNVCTYIQAVTMGYIGQRIVANIRNSLYESIQRQSLGFFTKNPTGILMSRITNDVVFIQSAVSETVAGVFRDFVAIVGYVGMLFYLDWKFAIVGIIIFPIVVYPIRRIGSAIHKTTTSTQVALGRISTLLQETIVGTRIVKAFGMEERENQRFAVENEKLFRLYFKALRTNSISSPLMDFLAGIGIATIISYGGYQVIAGNSTPGTFFAFLATLMLLYEPIKRLASANNTVQQGLSAAERVFEIMDQEPEITNHPQAVSLTVAPMTIEFRHVSFRYEEDYVLNDINLTIKSGEIIAFVGMSGSGKSTLLNLIPRFYEVSDGELLFDGVDIRLIKLESLRALVAMVTQQTFLFDDTIRNNIAYGNFDRSEDEITKSAIAANAHKFIMALPEGYNSVVGELGTKLSGGEKQRLAIARALLKDAPILILDEATSALDSESELEVQDALERLMVGKTTLVIAHRLSTIRKADKIVVLSKGRVVEVGSHEELWAKNGEYRHLHDLQFLLPK